MLSAADRAASTCSASATCATSTPTTAWRPRPAARPAAGADRRRRGRRGRGTSTSRSPPSRAWARTAWSSARPAPASPSCCAPWCSALAMTHSSETLNFVLVDFKGGATFAGMAELPHVSAVITNLADELTLVDRMQDALHGEMMRRQELLRAAGNFASSRDYEKARAARRRPRAAAVAVHRGRRVLRAALGQAGVHRPVRRDRPARPLAGVHLLLASQRLEEGRLRGLETHLSYRIGLRTFSAGESRAVLGVPDAYELPPVPGPRLPQARPDDADAVQGGLRLRAAAGPPAPGAPRPTGRQRRPGILAVHAGSGARRSPRCRPAGGRRRRAAEPEETRAVAARHRGRADERATAAARTRCGCRRSTCRHSSTSCSPTSPPHPELRPGRAGWRERGGLVRAGRHRRPAARAAPRRSDVRPRRRGRPRRRRRRPAAAARSTLLRTLVTASR